MTANVNNDARLVAEVILDGVAAFWRNEGDHPLAGVALLSADLTSDPRILVSGAILAGVSLTQGEIPFGDTQRSHLESAHEYLRALAPFEDET